MRAELVYWKLEHPGKDISPGPDMVYFSIMRESASILCEPLSVMFTYSLGLCKTPENWKLTHITTVFKGN